LSSSRPIDRFTDIIDNIDAVSEDLESLRRDCKAAIEELERRLRHDSDKQQP
jgi:hypothetical protein